MTGSIPPAPQFSCSAQGQFNFHFSSLFFHPFWKFWRQKFLAPFGNRNSGRPVRSLVAIELVGGTSCEILVYDFCKHCSQGCMTKMNISILFDRPFALPFSGSQNPVNLRIQGWETLLRIPDNGRKLQEACQQLLKRKRKRKQILFVGVQFINVNKRVSDLAKPLVANTLKTSILWDVTPCSLSQECCSPNHTSFFILILTATTTSNVTEVLRFVFPFLALPYEITRVAYLFRESYLVVRFWYTTSVETNSKGSVPVALE